MTPEALILTSDFELSHMVRMAVERFGMTTGIALRTTDAVSHLKKNKFDLLIVDCSDLDQGCAALRNIRLNPTHRTAVSIAIVGDRRHAKDASDSGANFVVSHANYEVEIVATLRSAYGLVLRERGRYNRFPSSSQIEVHCGSFLGDGRISNISQGGLCISGVRHTLQGQLQMRFALEQGRIPIQVTANVVWQRDGLLGVQFSTMTKASRMELEDWLTEQFEIQTKIRPPLVASTARDLPVDFEGIDAAQTVGSPNTRDIHPIVTAIISGGPVRAKCSACQATITFGNSISAPLEQERKLREAFAEHLQEKHQAAALKAGKSH